MISAHFLLLDKNSIFFVKRMLIVWFFLKNLYIVFLIDFFDGLVIEI